MKLFFKIQISIIIGIFVLLDTSCNNRWPEDGIAIRSISYECGNTAICDSTQARFRFRNISDDSIRFLLIPECDCTTISTEHLVIAPRDHAIVYANVKVDCVGEYVKYIFVQKEDSDFFISLSIHGNAISTK